MLPLADLPDEFRRDNAEYFCGSNLAEGVHDNRDIGKIARAAGV